MASLLSRFMPARSGTPIPGGNAPPERKAGLSANLFTLNALGQASWSQTDYGTLARNGYMANPIVHRCVRLIAETASAAPLLVYDGRQELEQHPLLELMQRPNQRQSHAEFLEGLFGHLLVAGNAYVEAVQLNDVPRELHLLRPDRMSVQSDERGWAEAYEYRTEGDVRVYRSDEATGFSSVLHVAQFHPLDDQYGFPALQAAAMALDVHNASNIWNKALLDNSARPSGALVYAAEGQNLTDEQFDRLKEELAEGYGGASKAGKPMLLEGGLDWKAMGYSPTDMDFVQARNAAARDIALAFGVPPMLLGIPGDNTYSNYQEANRAFARQTLLPLIRRVLGSVSHWLGPLYGGNPRLAVDEDAMEGLQAERDALWKRVAEAPFLTEEEQREAVGYSPSAER
jgi:HK97 family phage portal protein